VFKPIMRTLRPSLRRKVSPSTTRWTATGVSPLGAGQKAWAPESQIADIKKAPARDAFFISMEKP
jgi:hypothetical protein